MYGLSGPRRSRRVAERLQTVLQQWNQASANDTEELDEEYDEEYDDQEDARFQVGAMFLRREVGDDEYISGDDDDDDDGLYKFSSALPGHKGIAVWDLQGEGFLQEVSNLGMNYFITFSFLMT